MSLRAQMKGYTTRWVTYSNGGFKEGVSLTCDNELDRWQKVQRACTGIVGLTEPPADPQSSHAQYAFGCSELIFYPLKDWWRHGCVSSQPRICPH